MGSYNNRILYGLGMLSLMIGLYLTSLYSYLLFHSLAEFFSIAIAFALFMIAWNSQKYMKNSYFTFIGVAYLFVGGFDLIHVLGYKGMHIFTDYDYYANQLWIVARFLESISLFVAFHFFHIQRQYKAQFFMAIYLVVFVFFVLLIFYWKIFPVAFIEGYGQTLFKIISEYIICIILVMGVIRLRFNKSQFDSKVYNYLFWSLIFTITSEICFIVYTDNYGISNFLGHFSKIVSFYLIYKSIVDTGIRNPYDIIFRELKANENKLQRQAVIDELTGIYNRRAALEYLDKMLVLSKRDGEPLSICFIDLDNLKGVNDTFGHHEGDFMLRFLTEVLLGVVRESDFVCRLGGDEFLLILPNCTEQDAQAIVYRAKEKLANTVGSLNKPYLIDFSYGLAQNNPNPDGYLDVNHILEIADNNMYQNKEAKKIGSNNNNREITGDIT